MSMSRKTTQKFSSVSNFAPNLVGAAAGVYGDDLPSSSNIGHNRGASSKRLYANIITAEGSLERQINLGTNEKSVSQNRKGPQVPKLNINQIVYDSAN